MTTLHEYLAKRLEKWPLYSQVNQYDPFVGARLYSTYSDAVWYVTEYDPAERIAYGYVMKTGEKDRWVHIWIDLMEENRVAGGFKAICADENFVPTPFVRLSA